MEVKPASQRPMKTTEIGEIPEDWNVFDFGESFTFLSTATNARSDLADDGDSYYIHYGDIHTRLNGNITVAAARLPSIDIRKCGNASSLQVGDWVMADASEDVAGIGKAIEILEVDSAKPVIAGLHTYALRAKDDLFAQGFKGHLGEADYLTRQYRRLMTGMKVYGVSKAALKGILLALPSVNEQKAISAALSDADDYICGLEKLVDKKRAIKQGAMQELLTGRRRLPGFAKSSNMKMTEIGEIPEDWCIRRLGELADLYQPETIPATQFTEGGFPVYGANGKIGYFSQYNHELSQIAVTCRGSTCGTVNLIPARSWITGNAMVVNCDGNELILKNFLYWRLLAIDFSSCITGSGQPQIVRDPLEAVNISAPSLNEEQKAIAEVLYNMDDEITALETQLDKAKKVKQAMMQELLTGRTRLV